MPLGAPAKGETDPAPYTLRSRNIPTLGAITCRDTKERAMNVADERSMSCWLQDAPAIKAPPLQTDQTCDVVVIGSGIAGLSTAYELSRFGRSVIVIDRGKIGYGMTARTTAPCDRTRRFLLRAHPRAR